jgi:ubiquinone/menaquinone biosynthesis C-methylase UbiE
MATVDHGLFTSSLPETYERILVAPLFRPFAEELLDRTGFTRNERLLDVACGTGIVARLAQEEVGDRGRVVGVDASPAMLDVAKSVAPAIEWRQGDAARLPVNTGETFDVVTCHQGLQFFGDKPAAIREMRRVLVAGGRLAIGTWLSADEIPLIRDLQRVAERHVGPIVDQRHSLGDADAIRRLLADAGLTEIQVETVTRSIRLGSVFARLNAMALVAMSAAAKAMADEQRAHVIDAIANDSGDALEPYIVDSDIVFDLSMNVVIARA